MWPAWAMRLLSIRLKLFHRSSQTMESYRGVSEKDCHDSASWITATPRIDGSSSQAPALSSMASVES